MKRYLYILIMIFLCSSCIENTVDAQYEEDSEKPKTLRSLMTKSGTIPKTALLSKANFNQLADK